MHAHVCSLEQTARNAHYQNEQTLHVFISCSNPEIPQVEVQHRHIRSNITTWQAFHLQTTYA